MLYIYKLERYSFRIFEIKLDEKNKSNAGVEFDIDQCHSKARLHTHKKKKDKCYFEIKLIVTNSL